MPIRPKDVGESCLLVPIGPASNTNSNTGAQSVSASLPAERPARGPETVIEQLLRLDTSRRPGLSDTEFKKLFAKCSCGLIMTRRVFLGHICAPTLQAIPAIDLAPDVSDVTDLTAN